MKEKTNNTIEKWTKDANKLQTSYKRASKSGQNMWRLLVKEMQRNAQRDASSCPLYCAKCWRGSEGNRNSQCQLWQNWRSFWKAIWNHLVKVNLHTSCRLLSPPRHTLRAASQTGELPWHAKCKVATLIRHAGQKDRPGCPEGPVSPVDTYSRDALPVCTRRPVTSTHSSAVGVKCEKPPNVYRQNRQVSPYHKTLCSWEKTSTSTRMNHGNTAWS